MTKPRLLRITTVPVSLKLLLEGQLNYFQENGYEVLAVSAAGPEVTDLQASGINHQVVPMTRKITPFRDLLAVLRIIRVIRQFKPVIVHTHTPKAGLLGMLAAWMMRVPIRLHTVAGLPLMESKGFTRSILLVVEWVTYRCATGVYPNSAGLYEFIRNTIPTKTPVTIIGKGSSNGIDTSHFSRSKTLENAAAEIRKQHGFGQGDFVFSFVGRVVRDKGIAELIRAFQVIARDRDDVRLLIIGPLEQELDPLSDEDLTFLRTDSRVVLPGFQKDIRPWLLASDIFVFPSYREGFPNVVMQACCLQIPCVVSDINGCNEIIADHVTGMIVPPKNSERLANAMLTLMDNSELRSTYAESAAAFVRTNFDRMYIWKELEKEYQKHLRSAHIRP